MEDKDFSKAGEVVFSKRRTALICLYLSIPAIFAFAINKMLLFVPLGLFISFIAICWKYWKCPNCNRGFDMRHGVMDYATHCPYCGVRVRKEYD